MAEKTLDELKSALCEAFEQAAKDSTYRTDSGAQRTAMGTIAQAIVAIEKEQREAKESKSNFSLDGK